MNTVYTAHSSEKYLFIVRDTHFMGPTIYPYLLHKGFCNNIAMSHHFWLCYLGRTYISPITLSTGCFNQWLSFTNTREDEHNSSQTVLKWEDVQPFLSPLLESNCSGSADRVIYDFHKRASEAHTNKWEIAIKSIM